MHVLWNSIWVTQLLSRCTSGLIYIITIKNSIIKLQLLYWTVLLLYSFNNQCDVCNPYLPKKYRISQWLCSCSLTDTKEFTVTGCGYLCVYVGLRLVDGNGRLVLVLPLTILNLLLVRKRRFRLHNLFVASVRLMILFCLPTYFGLDLDTCPKMMSLWRTYMTATFLIISHFSH